MTVLVLKEYNLSINSQFKKNDRKDILELSIARYNDEVFRFAVAFIANLNGKKKKGLQMPLRHLLLYYFQFFGCFFIHFSGYFKSIGLLL